MERSEYITVICDTVAYIVRRLIDSKMSISEYQDALRFKKSFANDSIYELVDINEDSNKLFFLGDYEESNGFVENNRNEIRTWCNSINIHLLPLVLLRLNAIAKSMYKNQWKIKKIEEIKPLNVNTLETNLVIFYKEECAWYRSSLGKEGIYDPSLFIENLYYIDLSSSRLEGKDIKNYHVGNEIFSNIKEKGALKVTLSPITKEKALIEVDKIRKSEDGLGELHNVGIAGLEKEEDIQNKITDTIRSAVKLGSDIVVFPEMLGTRKMIQDTLKDLKDETKPPMIVFPSVWEYENKEENENGTNKSIICFFDGKELISMKKQFKKTSYQLGDGRREDIKESEGWEILVFHVDGIGRICLIICKDFITETVYEMLINELNCSLIIVPSYSTGEFDFSNYTYAFKKNDCNIIWCNTCAASNEQGAKKENFNTVAIASIFGKVQGKSDYSSNESVILFPGKNKCTKDNCEKCHFFYELTWKAWENGKIDKRKE